MNSDVIRLLPDSVANQIAAGEVIQRPASVIKELVENAVDAGATDITIILRDAGRTLIQVIDNGTGMSPTDARMAFERHATSKISQATDLYTLTTMGFRGEALPSIAAVAQIDLRTMRAGDTVGTRLLISESRFEGQEPVSCQAGTNIAVKNIFFHMPARRKFLKKDAVELSHILHEFERLALVNTAIGFTLIHNDVTLHKFGPGTLKQRIGALFGKNVESQLVPVATETAMVRVDGFVGLPRSAKKRGALQYLFVNGRNMRHPFFNKAIVRCYEQLIAPDTQPSFFVNFEVDPSTIDVNIHPQKHEIKFENESAIWQILEAAVRQSLGRCQATGALEFDMDAAPDIPLYSPDTAAGTPDDNFDTSYNPFAEPTQRSGEGEDEWRSPGRHTESNERSGDIPVATRPYTRPPIPQDWDKLYQAFTQKRAEAIAVPDGTLFATPEADSAPVHQAALHLPGGYVAVASATGMTLISPRRAHIRILYERYMAQLAQGDIPSQTLIFPDDIELSASVSAILECILPQLATVGFGLQRIDPTHWRIVSVPALQTEAVPRQVLLSLIEDVPTDVLDRAALQHPMALSLARSAAIKSTRTLTDTELDAILADLYRCAEPSFTPEGLPVMINISNDEVAQRFNP